MTLNKRSMFGNMVTSPEDDTEVDFDGLNREQRRAVQFKGKHALVLAGAGCGKTRVIEERIKYLISIGVPPHKIAVMAFTCRAAEEIKQRVTASMGDRAKGLEVSTFHGFCIKLIHQYPQLFGRPGFSVLDRSDQIALIKTLLDKNGKDRQGNRKKAEQYLKIYSFRVNTICTAEAAIANEDVELLAQKTAIVAVCKAYTARKKQRNYVDFDDILRAVADVLYLDSGARETVCRLFEHLLVDEFQDTNALQWRLLESFIGSAHLFCVGDDAQSIYAFRGADFDTVHSFSDKVLSATILKLTENYRSTQEILDVSNWLLKQSYLGYDKHLVAARGKGHKPRLLNFFHAGHEAGWIASDIALRNEHGRPWQDHMILVRSSSYARQIEAQLVQRDIPYIFIGGTKLLEAAHVKDLLSVLRIAANPQDELAWTRYLRLWPGIGEKRAAQIVQRVLARTSHEDAMQEIDNGTSRPCQVIRQILAIKGSPLRAVALAAQHLSPILESLYKDDWDKRRKDFLLVEKLAGKHTSIPAFIESYMLDPLNASEIKEGSNGDVVHLITVHSAKGTERKVCYVTNVSPGAYPSSKTSGIPGRIEEERRVLYVALTRAENELIVTKTLQDNGGFQRGSAAGGNAVEDAYFFDKLPKHLVEVEGH